MIVLLQTPSSTSFQPLHFFPKKFTPSARVSLLPQEIHSFLKKFTPSGRRSLLRLEDQRSNSLRLSTHSSCLPCQTIEYRLRIYQGRKAIATMYRFVRHNTGLLLPDRSPSPVGKPFISLEEYEAKVSVIWKEYVGKAAVVKIDS